MATPPRMVELKCPNCKCPHWEIDHDFRGTHLLGRPELSYGERSYSCPHCTATIAGYRVLRRSPPEFFLQPHGMYPMSVGNFAHWLALFREAFPEDDRLRSLGVFWYPGAKTGQEETLRRACQIGKAGSYRLSLSNRGPDDTRIRVCVQGNGEAHFWIDPAVTLDRCYFGFDEPELQQIRQLVAEKAPDARRAWQRFSSEARLAQAHWLSALTGGPAPSRWSRRLPPILARLISLVRPAPRAELPVTSRRK